MTNKQLEVIVAAAMLAYPKSTSVSINEHWHWDDNMRPSYRCDVWLPQVNRHTVIVSADDGEKLIDKLKATVESGD